jgi:hypothetical protein
VSFPYTNQTVVISLLTPYKKNKKIPKNFLIDGAASTIGGVPENNF